MYSMSIAIYAATIEAVLSYIKAVLEILQVSSSISQDYHGNCFLVSYTGESSVLISVTLFCTIKMNW